MTAEVFTERLMAHAAGGRRIPMRTVFDRAKEFIDLPPDEIERLLESPVHEVRAGALRIMDKQARRKKTPEGHRKKLFDLYLRIGGYLSGSRGTSSTGSPSRRTPESGGRRSSARCI